MVVLMLIAIVFSTGFGSGYAVRSYLSHRRRNADVAVDHGHW